MSPLCFNDGGSGGTRVYFSAADMLPFHATASGLAALAFGAPSLLENTLSSERTEYTGSTVTDNDQLRELVNKTRAQGFAYSDQAFEAEVSSVAVPFFESTDFAYGTISIAVPSSRIRNAGVEKYLAALWETSDAISNELGGMTPTNLKRIWKLAA